MDDAEAWTRAAAGDGARPEERPLYDVVLLQLHRHAALPAAHHESDASWAAVIAAIDDLLASQAKRRTADDLEPDH